MNHEAGSLPELVQNLVKNWEVEASFKPVLDDWRTVDHANYTFAINGSEPQGAENMLKVGNSFRTFMRVEQQLTNPSRSEPTTPSLPPTNTMIPTTPTLHRRIRHLSA
jgi:hypothetical protein